MASPYPSRALQDEEDAGLKDARRARLEKIYRKLDWRIIPAFWVLYFLCSAVRSTPGLSQTMNETSGDDLSQRLHITSKQISTALALYYVGYVVFEVPSNLVMSKLSPRVWMSRIVISVGIIGTCMTAMEAAWSFDLLRLLLGIVEAGLWPGMSFYLTLFYPPSRTGKRIGWYFTAAQLSAAVVGLVSAGFQKMNGLGGLVGFQWMFLLWGLVTFIVGVSLLWWLPDRPSRPGETVEPSNWWRWTPASLPVLSGEDALLHYEDMGAVYRSPTWHWKDLGRVLLDWRLWPLIIMYFGVVGVGNGVEAYGTVILQSINPNLSGVDLSLLFAPIWIMDLIAILLVMPLSDRFNRFRAIWFSFPTMIQVAGLLVTTYAGGSNTESWSRYGGLLIIGFGLGPTVPTVMAWTNEIFLARHGEVGVAAASALVSGLGNLGSVVTTYALYSGWPEDANSSHPYRRSNWAMIGILAASILSSIFLTVALRLTNGDGNNNFGRVVVERGPGMEHDETTSEKGPERVVES